VERALSLFHEEQRFWSAWVWALLLTIDLPFILLLAFTREMALLFGVIVVSLVAALFALARLVVDVTAEEITISFHLLWPTRRIRVADVRRAHATTYNSLLEYGGYGVRLGPRGWAFNTGGDEGVLVETNDGRRVMIGSRRAKELEAAIAKAVAARPA
jgi:hypothetical protein